MTWDAASQKRSAFSDAAHKAARRDIYPSVLQTDPSLLSFESVEYDESEREQVLDQDLGIDRLIEVKIESLYSPIRFSSQERFRLPQFADYQDLTVTEWHHGNDSPAELHKILADLFVYGYYDELADKFLDAIVIPVVSLKLALIHDRVVYERRRNDRAQSFLTIKFADLAAAKVPHWRMPRPAKQAA